MERKIAQQAARCASYKYLSRLFYLPDKKLFLREKIFEELTSCFQEICPAAAKLPARMKQELNQSNDEALAAEYATLFLGPYQLKAPPYGSVYLDQGKRVMGESTLQVRKLYGAAGLAIAEDFKELPDHIGVELEFMHHLLLQEIQALEKRSLNQAQSMHEQAHRFFRSYLASWTPLLCRAIASATKNLFYQTVGECLALFIENDTKYYI